MVHQWGFFGSISAIRKIWSLTANSRSLQAAALKFLVRETVTCDHKRRWQALLRDAGRVGAFLRRQPFELIRTLAVITGYIKNFEVCSGPISCKFSFEIILFRVCKRRCLFRKKYSKTLAERSRRLNGSF